MTFLLASLFAFSASVGAAERLKPAAERIREIKRESVPLLREVDAAAKALRALQPEYETARDWPSIVARREIAFGRFKKPLDKVEVLQDEFRLLSKRFFAEAAVEQMATVGGEGYSETSELNAEMALLIGDLDAKLKLARKEFNNIWDEDRILYFQAEKAVRTRRAARMIIASLVVAMLLSGLFFILSGRKEGRS